MKHIFKQSEGSDTSSKANDFKKAVIRLTFYYSISVFFILLISNVFVYGLFSNSFENELHEEENETLEYEYFEREDEFEEQAKEDLFNVLLLSDFLLTLITILIAYIVAKKTLKPLENAHQKQKRFVADAAHELRTPLAVMKAGSEVLFTKERTIDEYQKYIHESQEEVDRLIVLANDLLFLAQTKSTQKRSRSQFSLSDICNKKVEQTHAYARIKNITMQQDIEPNIHIFGMPDDISRLILNLIKNAIDHNVVGGSVYVELKKNKSNADLSIRDTGVGISDTDISHIFERFYKADTSRTHTQKSGTGLGLAIVKEIIEEHGGSITVSSKVGTGTTFKITIPSV